MAGVNPNFDATAFEEGIRFAMKMGAPVMETDRVTFRFARTTTYPLGTRLDREGRPLDPKIKRTESISRPDEQVDCAVEYVAAGRTDEGPVGRFPNSQVVLTLFAVDYELVKDAREILIGGETYTVAFRPPPLGLFNVGFQQIIAYPKDDT